MSKISIGTNKSPFESISLSFAALITTKYHGNLWVCNPELAPGCSSISQTRAYLSSLMILLAISNITLNNDFINF
jgi:hypothetical protein